MQAAETASAQSETEFAALIDTIAADPQARAQLTDFLCEDLPIYRERSAKAVVRMRGWVLLALARAGVPEAALIFLIEELQSGVDPYLVAAAARALRACPRPSAALAPLVWRALNNVRYHDEPLSLTRYGEYALTSETSAVRELIATLAWLGAHARAILPELRALRHEGGLSRTLRLDLDRALQAISATDDETRMDSCCCPPQSDVTADTISRTRPDLSRTSAQGPENRRDPGPVDAVRFEDHAGATITFGAFFHGHPTIVVFFYTRCDNPLKCSLTVAKLAGIQKLLAADELAEKIHTAAITYDPAFDVPERLRVYGEDRGVRLDARHRMLRAPRDNKALRQYFGLGVNFIASLVNRHRIEAYILDSQGRIAVSFERLQFDEREVVARAIKVLRDAGR